MFWFLKSGGVNSSQARQASYVPALYELHMHSYDLFFLCTLSIQDGKDWILDGIVLVVSGYALTTLLGVIAHLLR